jgi:ribosome-binding protein aMBF1 (putative translation factor)
MTRASGLTSDGMEDGQDWEEDSGDFLKMVGRQVKLWREQAKLTQPELGQRIGYSDELISSVERGRRSPQPDFLDGVDDVLGANGLLKA